MPNLLLRAVPPEVHRALKRQASLNGRSLQQEVQFILRDAVGDTLRPDDTHVLHVSNAPMVAEIRREMMYRDG